MEVRGHVALVPEITTPNPSTLFQVVRLTLPKHIGGPLFPVSLLGDTRDDESHETGKSQEFPLTLPSP